MDKDTKWLQAKTIAKQHYGLDWVKVLDIYRRLDGRNIQLFIVVNEDSKRVLTELEDTTVLTLNREGNPEIYDYDTVLTSVKNFIYKEQVSPQTLTLDTPTTRGETELTYYE